MLLLSLAHPPMPCMLPEEKLCKTTGDVIVTCFHVGMPPRIKMIESLQTHPEKNALIRILRMPHVHWGSSQMDL